MQDSEFAKETVHFMLDYNPQLNRSKKGWMFLTFELQLTCLTARYMNRVKESLWWSLL